jgi:adenylate kinase family enzyme
MDIVVIVGAPAAGKTTVAKALRQELGGAHIDMGVFREMYLDPAWTAANPAEAQMAFELACHTARTFVQNRISPVFLVDLCPEHLPQLERQFGQHSYAIVSLTVSDRGILAGRMAHPARDSGFRDIEAAWAWNQSELGREPLPHEVRLDTTESSVSETTARISGIVRSCCKYE